MKKCGHTPMLERPDEAAGHYLDFLKNDLIAAQRRFLDTSLKLLLNFFHDGAMLQHCLFYIEVTPAHCHDIC